jgi:hypothetical protein
MISFRVIAFFSTLVITTGFAVAQSTVQGSKSKDQITEPPFSITIGVQQSVVKVGSKLLVKVTFKNTTDHDIIIPVEEGLPMDMRIDVRDGQGKRALLLKPRPPAPNPSIPLKPEDLPTGSRRGVLYPAGGSESEEIDIAQIYNLSQPGTYTIRAQHPLQPDNTRVNSNSISITVAP